MGSCLLYLDILRSYYNIYKNFWALFLNPQLSSTGQKRTLHADIASVGTESEADDSWNKALVQRTQIQRWILSFSSDVDSLIFSISVKLF